MPVFAAKDHLSEVIGLKNDIVFKVFSCPDCKTDVTVSRYQVEGQLAVVCARCNCRYMIKGEQIVDENTEKQYFVERWEDGKPRQTTTGYKVYMRLDATQKVTAIPKDSFTLVMKPQLAAPKPAAPPRPAGAPGVAAPAAAAKPVAPATPAAPAAPAAPKTDEAPQA